MTAVWTSITTSLALTGGGVDPSAVDRSLGLAQLAEQQTGASIRHGPGWWAYTLDEHFSADLGEQVAALTAQVGPRLDELRELSAAGCFAQVSIAGTVRADERLTLSPESADRLAALGLPVSFTTRLEGDTASEDPLDWLD
ncbi:DUF4279 domain-containing protein [Streptomyces sp. NPDC093600]|uniref:DUF4279 domain-containing protein n=1 Tax=Streptomyces sp. NPDC093600 TaxID=3366047 RepID=UPI00380D2AD6